MGQRTLSKTQMIRAAHALMDSCCACNHPKRTDTVDVVARRHRIDLREINGGNPRFKWLMAHATRKHPLGEVCFEAASMLYTEAMSGWWHMH